MECRGGGGGEMGNESMSFAFFFLDLTDSLSSSGNRDDQKSKTFFFLAQKHIFLLEFHNSFYPSHANRVK